MTKDKKPYWENPADRREFQINFFGGLGFVFLAAVGSHFTDKYTQPTHLATKQNAGVAATPAETSMDENIIVTDTSCVVVTTPLPPSS